MALQHDDRAAPSTEGVGEQAAQKPAVSGSPGHTLTRAWPWVRRGLPIVAVVALIVTLSVISAGVRGARLGPDARQNLAVAHQIRVAHEFSMDGETPTHLREPLPLLLTAVYMRFFTDIPWSATTEQVTHETYFIGQVLPVNIVYEVALFLVLWWLAWRLTRSHVVAFLAILGTWVFMFQSVYAVRSLLTETPAALVLVVAAALAVWSLQSGRLVAAVLTGFALGAVALTKAAGLYVGAVAIPILAVAPLLMSGSRSDDTAVQSPADAGPPSRPDNTVVQPPDDAPSLADAAEGAPTAETREGGRRAAWSTGPRRAFLTFAVMAVAFTVTVTPWLVRNYLLFDDLTIAERSGNVLFVRAVLDGMSAEEYLGAFYVYAPTGLRGPVFERVLGFQPEDLRTGGRYVRLLRNQPGDAEAVASGDVDLAESYFGQAGAMMTQLRDQMRADGEPPDRFDVRIREEAMDMIQASPARHLALTVPFAWRGLWSFVHREHLIVALVDFLAFASLLALPGLALWKRRLDWFALSLVGFGLFWFHALLTHFIPRYSEPLIPLAVLSALVLLHAGFVHLDARRRVT